MSASESPTSSACTTELDSSESVLSRWGQIYPQTQNKPIKAVKERSWIYVPGEFVFKKIFTNLYGGILKGIGKFQGPSIHSGYAKQPRVFTAVVSNQYLTSSIISIIIYICGYKI